MFPPWRFHLKTAQQALDAGRVDETLQIIDRERLTEYGPGEQLRIAAGRALGVRAAQRATNGELEGGWQDVRQCQAILGDSPEWSQAVGAVLHAELEAVARHWQAANFRAAWEHLQILGHRCDAELDLDGLQEISRRLESAHKLAARGKFAESDEQYAAASALRKDLVIVEQLREINRHRQEQARSLEEQLHQALGEQQWTKAVELADAYLMIAPQCHLARDARRRAWAEVGANLSDTQAHQPRAIAADESTTPTDPRFLLWIDAVGGYLVCLGNEIVLGQAQPQGEADVPLQADVSRRHARIIRDTEGYLLEPVAQTLLNGQAVTEVVLLNDGDVLEIGVVRIRFRKPHALSASARLEFMSRHRTHPYADGVILMADSFVLGQKKKSHVFCRGWRGEVILFRQGPDLHCRGEEALEIDGKLVEGKGPITWNSIIAGSDFNMKLERI